MNARTIIDSIHESDIVSRIVSRVEGSLGDVISDEHSAENPNVSASEECWTLCIDVANGILGQGSAAIRAAKEACAELGYPQKGYRAKPKGRVEPIWPPKPYYGPGEKRYSASDLAPSDKPPKTTGVVHPAYRPDVPLLRRKDS